MKRDALKVEDLGISELSSHQEMTWLVKWTTVLENIGEFYHI